MTDDDLGQLLVQRLALAVQPLELSAIGGQRPGGPLAAQPGGRAVDIDPDDEMLGERGPHRRRGDGPSAEREHARPGGAQQLERDTLLGLPEHALSILAEDPVDRLAEPLLDHVVDVNRARTERLGGAARGGRLTGAHEADHRDHAALAARRVGELQSRCHPIRRL